MPPHHDPRAPARPDGRLRVALGCDFHLKYAAGLASGLREAGADPLLVTRGHALEFGGDAETMDRELGARVGDARVVLGGKSRDPRPVPAALARIRRFRPAVVHVQERITNDPRLLVALAARPGRYALTVHDPVLHPGDRPRARAAALADTALIRGAGLVFVHAAALRDELLARTRLRAPVVVVPHGSDPPVSRPLPADPTLLFFGRLSAYKGLDVLLDAMPLVWDELPAARLVVAGAGDLPAHATLGDERVTVRHEHVPEGEVRDLVAAASAVVLPYRQASQSGVGTVAKANGRASIVTAVGGLPELVADGSGVVVAPEDPAALAQAAVRVLADRDLAERMGRLAAATAAGEAGWPRVAELTLEAYASAGLA